MFKSEFYLVIVCFFIGKIFSEEHELIYNEDFVYYDECRVTVSPRNYLQPVRAYTQVQKPCNGTLLWTYPNLNLTLTIVNLENDSFTICFEKKSIEEKLVRSIKSFYSKTNQTNPMHEVHGSSGTLLCSTSQGNRISVIIEALPLYAGIHLRYAMFNERHPWTAGPYPGWERSEKYLFGPPEHIPMKQKKVRRNRKKLH
ncbi:hypothetical protein I4U23_007337 [Adineta vaga]|nr:hypothetical protein I4U23_007337 [Adineta vaga]